MSKVKKFIIGYSVIYLVAAVTLNVLLGPPGLSRAYLDEYKADHDTYLDVIKSDPYKLWSENPALNPPDEALRSDIEFATEYENRAQFKSEDTRRGRYGLAFEIFNVAVILLLVMRFGRKPIVDLIDSMIQAVRERIGDAEGQRQAAGARKTEARSKLAGLPGEESKHGVVTDEHIEREVEKIKETTAQGLSLLKRETADREHHEEVLAAGEMKRALVDEALKVLTERYDAKRSPETESALLDQFAALLGDRKS